MASTGVALPRLNFLYAGNAKPVCGLLYASRNSESRPRAARLPVVPARFRIVGDGKWPQAARAHSLEAKWWGYRGLRGESAGRRRRALEKDETEPAADPRNTDTPRGVGTLAAKPQSLTDGPQYSTL